MKVYYLVDLNAIYEPEINEPLVDICSSREAVYKNIIKQMEDNGISEYYISSLKEFIQEGTIEEYMKEEGLHIVEQEIIN